jgi:hypothetical protein
MKLRVALTGIVAGATLCAGVPANASTGGASLAGSGTISPGLPAPGDTWTFSGTGAVATDRVQGLFSCTVNGNDSIGSYTQGAGSFSGSCTTACGTSTVNGSFTRVGGLITLSGTASGGCMSATFTGDCSFEPTSFPVIRSYESACDLTLS